MKPRDSKPRDSKPHDPMKPFNVTMVVIIVCVLACFMFGFYTVSR